MPIHYVGTISGIPYTRMLIYQGARLPQADLAELVGCTASDNAAWRTPHLEIAASMHELWTDGRCGMT
jgi:hypothetical protein